MKNEPAQPRFRPMMDVGNRPAQRLSTKILIPLVAVGVLALVGWGTDFIVQRAMKSVVAAKLQTILDTDVLALKIWLDTQKRAASTAVAVPGVRHAIRELVEMADKSAPRLDALRGSLPIERLRAILEPVCEAQGYGDFLVVEPDGISLGSMRDEVIGKRVAPAGSGFLERALAGEVVVSKPHRTEISFPDENGVLRSGPTMFAAAPVRDAMGVIIAVLALPIRPEKDFAHIVTTGRPGLSGETYVFDENGVMISQSRFEKMLKQLGLLGEDSESGSVSNLELRDPGGNLLEGFRSVPRSEQPLTLMAASAVAGNSDINVEGYRDYRGVPVIGAWTWLDEFGVGVTTELDVAEAFRPLRLLRYAFGFIFCLLMVAALGALFFARIISALHLRMERLGQYTLERKLGKGGMGAVYLARHAMLRRPTALKILRREHSSEEAMARFEREVQLTSQLSHLNTVRIYDYGRTPDGTFYYAMEFLPGINLHTLVEETGPLPEARVIHILLQVCASLKEAHSIGLIHRDIKPENLIIYERGGDYDMVKVLDFGLVKYVAEGERGGGESEQPAGTPQYLSPEAFSNPSRIDGRSDLYSVGGVAYYLLTGTDVFEGKSPIEICKKHLNEQPQPPSQRLGRPVSEDLENLILKCLEKEPDDRPSDAANLIKALEECRDAGLWTQREAKTWWDEVGHALVEKVMLEAEPPELSESMMAVDLEKRMKSSKGNRPPLQEV